MTWLVRWSITPTLSLSLTRLQAHPSAHPPLPRQRRYFILIAGQAVETLINNDIFWKDRRPPVAGATRSRGDNSARQRLFSAGCWCASPLDTIWSERAGVSTACAPALTDAAQLGRRFKGKFSPFPKNMELLAPIDTADQIILWINFIWYKSYSDGGWAPKARGRGQTIDGNPT